MVLIIGMFDLLGMGKAALTNLNWAGLHKEMYLFVAVVFFFCCYGMSLYSGYLERKLDTENKFQKKIGFQEHTMAKKPNGENVIRIEGMHKWFGGFPCPERHRS